MPKNILEIGKKDLEYYLQGIDTENKFFSDSAYAVLEESWLLGEGYKSYRKWLNLGGLGKWRNNWDCDNLAVSFKLYLQMLHAKHNPYTFTDRWKRKAENTTNVESVAVGVVYYKIEREGSSSMHAINLAFCPSGFGFSPTGNFHTLKKLYIEPEDGTVKELTEKEEASIWYANF